MSREKIALNIEELRYMHEVAGCNSTQGRIQDKNQGEKSGSQNRFYEALIPHAPHLAPHAIPRGGGGLEILPSKPTQAGTEMMGADMKAGASTQAGEQANIRDTKRGANIKNRPAIIAGNGPSLARIDYTRLPRDFDVYRCNQFYFEEKYYLGKRVQGVLFHPDLFFAQYHTLKTLEARGEYEFGEIYCNRIFGREAPLMAHPLFGMIFPDALETYRLLEPHSEIYVFLKYQDMYFNRCPTSGVVAVLLAALQGYREMHLIGIDFYEGGDYAFDAKKENLLKLMPNCKKGAKTKYHSKGLDLKVLEMAREYFDLKLYNLALEDSPIGLPRSPVVNSGFILEDKPLDSIKDIIPPEVIDPLECYGDGLDVLREVHYTTKRNTFLRCYLDIKRIFRAIWQAIAR